MDKKKYYRLAPWLAALLCAVAAFVFLQWWYPYHLFRREQTMIFLMDHEFVGRYLWHPGWLASLAGDFLTQFFYYVGAGAAITGVLLGLLWLAVWAALRRMGCGTAVSAVAATAVYVWELLRQCGDAYTLGSTLSLAGAFALLPAVLAVRNKVGRPLAAAGVIALCYWCLGYSAFILALMCAVAAVATAKTARSWATMCVALAAMAVMPKSALEKTDWWGWPNFALEHKLAIDSEAYFGNWQRVRALAAEQPEMRHSSFYSYLINAMMGRLPDGLLTRMPRNAEALLPTMDPDKNSLDLSALSEAWYYMGDMTAAEHCTIVAMISTARNTGSRYLRRMAEINLANGDHEAAMKYLRMLSKTICHAGWAASRMPGAETDRARSMRQDVARYTVGSDTVRYVNDYTRSLRHLVKGHPDNDMAYDYLLCHHLLRCDIKAFMEDYDPARHTPRLYQEALLVHLSIVGASEDEVAAYGIPDDALEDFYHFNTMMPMTDANRQQVAARFGNTYWYFYQLAQNNENK